jgi:16S rRNA (guanine527-N7)-methyltransferase
MITLREVAIQLRFALSPQQLQAFDLYYKELAKARPRAGLTSLTGRESVERRHFLEPLVLLRALEGAGAFESPAIDIGSGAGFPGLPIKIVRPELQLTLLDASGRKVNFLKHLIQRLEVGGVTAIHCRAEDLARDPAHRAAYALALARAVAPLRVLVELSLPFVRVGGYLATPKGSGAQREVGEASAALKACGGEVDRVHKLDLPWPGPSPTLVLIRKIADTPDRYPRRAGIPGKRPL